MGPREKASDMIRWRQRLYLWRGLLRRIHFPRKKDVFYPGPGDLPCQAVNVMIFHAWLSGIFQWSFSPEGTTLDLAQLEEGCNKGLADGLASVSATDPLISAADRPAQINPRAVGEWLQAQEARPLGQAAEHSSIGIIRTMCRHYLDDASLLAQLYPRLGALWPFIPVRLWLMTNGAEGYSPWRLFPRRETCHGRVALSISGQPYSGHVTYAPSRVDIRLVPAAPPSATTA